MTNKEKLKRAIEQDINSKDYYKEIIKKIEKDDKMKKEKNLWKWSFVPICLVAIIGGVLLVNNNNKELKTNIYKPNIETKDNVNLYINDVSKMVQDDADVQNADIKITNIENISYFKEIADIKVPSDFDNQETYGIYVKHDRDSNDYNILQSYVINYSNKKNDRNIRISFSKENKPVRDYYFSEEGSRMSSINNFELKIFKYNKLYFTEFNYKDINFDIETSNITEQELTNLLLSILK